MAEFPNVVSERLRLWRHGRDAYVHRILTLLFLGRSPDPWNNPSRLSNNGANFLKLLDQVLFDEKWDTTEQFYWEYKLLKRPEDRGHGWPDFAALWTDRVLLFELRSEPGSHRDAQIDWYLQLGAHNYGGRAIDVVHLSPDPITAKGHVLPDLARVRNCSWAELAKVIDVAWGKAHGSEAFNALTFAQYLRQIGRARDLPELALPVDARAVRQRTAKQLEQEPPVMTFSKPVWARILDTMVEVLEDGSERALELPAAGTEQAREMRRKVRADLEVGDWLGDDGRKLELWIWNRDCGGEALTEAGEESGAEIRVCRVQRG
ncbi:MAG: hypothetical protein ACT4OM_10645 [Actinomycetota bacterium]